jgi:PAS domain S-box-containing protein
MQDEQEGRFTQADVDTLTTLAGQMASSIESAELFGQVEQERTQAEKLYEISNKLNTAQNREEILRILSETAIEAGAGSTNLISLSTDDEGNPEWAEILASFRTEGSPEIEGMDVGARFFMPDMPFSKVWMADKYSARLIADVNTDESLDDMSRELMRQGGAQSLVIIPLTLGDNWLGFVTFNWLKQHTFSSSEAQIYNSLIGLGSQALARQMFQEAQMQSEARFRTLFDYAPEGVFVINVDTLSFDDTNERAAELFGYTREEFLKVSPMDVSAEIQPDGRPAAEVMGEAIQAAMAGGSPRLEAMYKRASGEEFPVDVQVVKLPETGRNLVRVSFVDMTERKQYEDGLVQTDRLKSEFLANMSHELRTPLNSIIGYTDVLLLGADGDLNDEIRKDLEAIQDNSDHLLRLINDILDLAKIEAGRMTFELSKVNIEELYQDTIKANAGLLINKNLQMKTEVQSGLPELVADKNRLSQVITNLVSNAIKFTEKGSIMLRASQENDWIKLEVEDQGKGIEPGHLEMIFDEFTQVDPSSTRTAEGTGLGLAISRHLVQMHGGEISVESEVGKGSTFIVRLPVEAKVSPQVIVTNGNVNEKLGDLLTK